MLNAFPKSLTLHDQTLHDDYYWLRDAKNPEVITYFKMKIAILKTVMQPTQDLQETLYQEMLSHIQEEDHNVPVQDGPYFYYARTEMDKQYPIYCRKKAASRQDLNATPEEILIDFNQVAEGKAFFSVSLVKISPDHSKLAYLQNENGTDYYTLYVKDIATQSDLIKPIPNVSINRSVEWDASNTNLFYVVSNSQQKSYQIYRYSLPLQTSVLTYEEKDETIFC